MKKKVYMILLALVLVVTGCTSSNNKDNEKINVVASFFPVYDLIKRVGGDKVEVNNLTQTGDAHSFEPGIKDMENISKSDLLAINGAGFEGWIDQIKSSQPDLQVLDLSEDLDLIEVDGHTDPHTWLSVKNPQLMLEKIKDKLIELDKKNEAYYNENYQKALEEFKTVEKKYDEELSKYKGRAFIAPHAAFNYLLQEYDLEQVGIEGINSVNEPNAARMKEIVDIMKNKNINTVFYEYGQSDKIAQTVAEEVNGKVLPISTLEVITQKDVDDGMDYIKLLEMNLENLVTSFE
ncbi:metal ABC transporter solute-binding protein, Zn/Mn family [uncultured Helcococcus sp.]|uniref:metal ABC transporter substrate-binding protein n=1 Tax=uncultured Helcococcus sp. TaxID=1072508 RepID=UPI002889CF8C|nr:zinc ABC transporter substrate-binding protein [uncultured Helcococcus sp.]